MEISKITAPSDWVYFAKGNANILFKYTGTNDYLRHKLLRLRLLKEDEQYISTCELYDFIELKCKHLFPQQIIDIQLVVLTTAFITQLDNKGHQLMLTERYGLLIPNILDGNYAKQALSRNCHLYYDSPADSSHISSVIFEIKPKWLYDNKSSNYCRTCSLNQLRGLPRHFCPLDLLYKKTIDEGLNDIFRPIPQQVLDNLQDTNRIPLKALFRNFLNNPENVFQKLKQYQRINNKNDLIKNLTSIHDVLQNLSLVMTLRDVGLFIKFEKYDRWNNIHNSHNNVNNLITIEGYGKFLVTCNIYDLDLKSKLKYKHWLDIEQKLQAIYNSSNKEWKYCKRVDKDDDFLET
ncbi:inositol-pentakisphosphate 2-kinase [Suhomyces tanzawaensis NRRL Y-17324]|uniref:Inositol-pentakisphosphate 2-kinase n=1 Tax=Suhomyces tanzawaensis NRRL Y-17324 TaxID=984487 RepID=A0A1E4SM80_9ASCO|nr:inositol-pentakisphosphate 2-kinase [Suhomyces tanzawaensis NRRL Y-17324]ODV80636.1 inositol-pentakisphosphate 2-kinase [Suhomyces tanzawaensis NRRL Y-17324]